MRAILVLLACAAVASCTSRPIVMRNPVTGQTTDCGSRSELWAWDVESNPGREMACVRDYQMQGWVRAPGN
jgi:hypothetical protein